MTVTRFNMPRALAFDQNGVTIPLATLTFYEFATPVASTTLQNTFTDETLTIANINPVEADNAGRFPDIFLAESLYRVVFQNAESVIIWDAGPVNTEGEASTTIRRVFAFDGDGVQTAFDTLNGTLPTDQLSWDIAIQGIQQEHNSTVYTISGSVITFTSPPPDQASIEAIVTNPLSDIGTFGFNDLIDTPNGYTGFANQVVRVTAAEDGLEFSPVVETDANGLVTDVVTELTPAAGVTIDGVVLKDSGITATGGGSLTGTWTDLGSVTTVDINGGTADTFIIGGAVPAAATFTTLNATGGGALTGTWTDLGSVTTIDINGGTVDGAVIGGATPAAATFTTLNATGGGALTGTWTDLGSVTTIDINGGTIDGTIIGGSVVANGSFAALVGTTGTFSGVLNVDDATGSTTPSSGSAVFDGGIGVAENIIGGQLVKTEADVTGNRPTPQGAGSMWFDTTLGIPIWHDGTNWIDATGSTV